MIPGCGSCNCNDVMYEGTPPHWTTLRPE